MKIPDSKLPDIGTTIFATMSALAQELGAVNLGQGFPDFGCDPRLLDMMNEAMRAGYNQYPPMTGVPELREAISQKVAALYDKVYDPANEVTVTAGATQAIQTALTAIVRPGDEVVIFEPVYDSYDPVIRLNGGTPIHATLRFPDFRPDWDAVKALITPRTRAIMVNSPHNPTATTWCPEDLQALSDLLRGTDIMLISDEVYEHMVFDGRRHLSASSIPGLAERAFVVSSFGKTYHITGWKIAYCLAPKELSAEFRKAHQFIVFTVHTPSQYAIARYMQLGTHHQLSDFYQAKRDFFLSCTAGSRLRFQASHGTYFVLASYGHLPEFKHLPEAEFAFMLVRKIGVACIPVSAFYHDAVEQQTVRFCFAKREETLAIASKRLATL